MAVLSVDDAAVIAGVPAHQLKLWAYDRSGGPRNIGTRHKPRYDEDDVREWRAGKEGLAAVASAVLSHDSGITDEIRGVKDRGRDENAGC